MIKPTVGRVVWYRPALHNAHAAAANENTRYAAMIAFVHSDNMVNLGILDPNGVHFNQTSVTLVSPGEPCNPGQCEWMPYQVGQAARTEAAEAALKSGNSA